MKQLDQRSLEESRAAEELKRSRMGNKRYFDAHKRLRTAGQQLGVGDLVLLHNTAIQTSHNVKLEDQWFGPYRIREVSELGFYRLDELDGVELQESFAGNRLKRFFARTEFATRDTQLPVDGEEPDESEDEEDDEEKMMRGV